MKEKTFQTIIITIMIVSLGIIATLGVINLKGTQKIKNFYSMTTEVIQVSRANDTVTVKDFNGNLWQFKGSEDWYAGEICSCIMDNKGTPEIKDDEIIKVHYDGWAD